MIPLIILGYRRLVEIAILDSWVKAVLRPVKGRA